MSGTHERIVGALLVGSLLPVLVVVWLGLMNEGFSSLAFLLYPGPETWLQVALLALFFALLGTYPPNPRRRTLDDGRSASKLWFIAGLVGCTVTSTILYAIGLGETPWRKFYTYVVAPRAVSAWLACAVAALMLVRKQRGPKHAV